MLHSRQHSKDIFTSTARAVVKHCDECVCLCVCVCVCVCVCLYVYLSDRISPGTTRATLSTFLRMLPMSVVLLGHVYDRPHRLPPGRDFSSALTMHYNALAEKGIIRSPITSCSTTCTRDHSVAAAFAENGIGWEGGDGSAQRG